MYMLNKEFNNKTDILKGLFKELKELKYNKSKVSLSKHIENINIQKETYEKIITYIDDFSKYIENIKENENILDYYDELLKLSILLNKIPKLKEITIEKNISLISLSLNNKLNNKITIFDRTIKDLLKRIDEYREKENEIINKVEKIANDKENILKTINREKKKIKKEIEELTKELNNTFKLNVFKIDKLKSKIDLLNEELKQYIEKESLLQDEFEDKIYKENLKIDKLKQTLK